MENTVFFWAKDLMERWYLLITRKFIVWTFPRWEIRSFFEPKSWWKDDIYLVFLNFQWYSRIWEKAFFVQCSLRNIKTSSSNKSHIAKIENYTDQTFDQAALKHLKTQFLTEIKIPLDKNNTNVKKLKSNVLGTTITTLLENLDCTSKPLRVKCTS